jgi:dTDP-4-dehydrorhamnose reductase
MLGCESMRVLVIGRDGQVGHELCALLADCHELTALGRPELDLADADALAAAISAAKPEIIVNAAAWNDVDGAESHADEAMRINRDAVADLGRLATQHRAALIHYSSDFVFDGTKGAPYVEDDPPNPLGAYGASKLAGETALFERACPAIVLRTAWVYSLRRKSFVSTILRLARERPELRVVDDQIGNPTSATELAKATIALIERLGTDPHATAISHAGIYHLACGGSCSRYELARAAIELDPWRDEHVVRAILPISSTEFPTPARRPSQVSLDCSKVQRTFALQMAPWRDALVTALARTTA